MEDLLIELRTLGALDLRESDGRTLGAATRTLAESLRAARQFMPPGGAWWAGDLCRGYVPVLAYADVEAVSASGSVRSNISGYGG